MIGVGQVDHKPVASFPCRNCQRDAVHHEPQEIIPAPNLVDRYYSLVGHKRSVRVMWFQAFKIEI
jgi:hypothetical protein